MLLFSLTFCKAKQKHRKESSDNDSESDGMFMCMFMHMYIIWTALYMNTECAIICIGGNS